MKEEIKKQRNRLLQLTESFVEVADIAHTSKQAVSNWFSRNGIPQKPAERIARHFGVSVDWLLYGRGEKIRDEGAQYLGEISAWGSDTPLESDEVELPFYMDVELAAGDGSFANAEYTGPKLRFSRSTLRKCGVDVNCAACVLVHGDSMAPQLPDGSTVGIDTAAKTIKDGKTYAIDHEGMLRIKRLYTLPGGGLRVNSFNSVEYPDEHYSAEEAQNIHVIGRVFWSSVLW